MSLGIIDLQLIRLALKARLDSLFQGSNVNVYATMPDSPRLPYVAIVPSTGDYIGYWATFGPNGLSDVALTLIIDPGAMAIDTQIALDDYLGVGTDRSIVSCIEVDRQLGNTVQECFAQSATVTREQNPYGGSDWYATIPLQIIAKRGGN